MEDIYETGAELFGDASIMMLALMIFLAVAVLSFGMMAMIRTRGLIKRRASGIAEYSGEREAAESRSLRQSSLRAVQRILDYTTKHYTANQEGAAKVLRRRMIQAGIFDSSAVAFYFVARLLMGVLLAIATFVALPWLGLAEQSEPALWVVVLV